MRKFRWELIQKLNEKFFNRQVPIVKRNREMQIKHRMKSREVWNKNRENGTKDAKFKVLIFQLHACLPAKRQTPNTMPTRLFLHHITYNPCLFFTSLLVSLRIILSRSYTSSHSHCKSFSLFVAKAAPIILNAPINKQTAIAFGPSVP